MAEREDSGMGGGELWLQLGDAGGTASTGSRSRKSEATMAEASVAADKDCWRSSGLPC